MKVRCIKEPMWNHDNLVPGVVYTVEDEKPMDDGYRFSFSLVECQLNKYLEKYFYPEEFFERVNGSN